MTEQKAVVEAYTEGFRTGDLAKIVSCLSDDVVWELHGDKTLVGRDAFAAEADSGDGPNPQLTLDRLVEEGAPLRSSGTAASCSAKVTRSNSSTPRCSRSQTV